MWCFIGPRPNKVQGPEDSPVWSLGSPLLLRNTSHILLIKTASLTQSRSFTGSKGFSHFLLPCFSQPHKKWDYELDTASNSQIGALLRTETCWQADGIVWLPPWTMAGTTFGALQWHKAACRLAHYLSTRTPQKGSRQLGAHTPPENTGAKRSYSTTVVLVHDPNHFMVLVRNRSLHYQHIPAMN